MMNNDRKEVKTRYLVSSEREIPILSKEFPLVIEPNTDNSLEFICEYLSANSNFILDNIREHGAILLRGFALKEACDFEKVMLSIKGLSGISHLFLDKANRKAVEGTQYVFPTNNIVRTGGTTNLSAFHSENYYTPEIPQFISFFCKSPAVYGGETGIVDMEKVFLLMNDGLKDKITNKLFFVKKWPITEVCKKYNLDRAALEEVCANYGLLIEGDYIFLNKPCAFVNPNTQVMSFVAACSREIQGLNEFILEIFKESYRSYKWFKHKLLWRLPNFHKKYHLAVIIKNFIRYPKRFKPIFKEVIAEYKEIQGSSNFSQHPRINTVFSKQDTEELAKLMRQHYSSSKWQVGDVLIIDNVKVSHVGMPGKISRHKSRLLHVMLCNYINVHDVFKTT